MEYSQPFFPSSLEFLKGAFSVPYYSFCMLMTFPQKHIIQTCFYLLTIPGVISIWLIPLIDLDSIFNWSQKWNLKFNSSKCSFIQFCSGHSLAVSSYQYSLNSSPLIHKECHKDLGILLTSDLSWSAHYRYIFSKAYKQLAMKDIQ